MSAAVASSSVVSGQPAGRWPLAYIAGMFPLRSETFVYREVRGLRQRGWEVTAVSLNRPPQGDCPELADLRAGVLVVYDRVIGSLVASCGELASHPMRSLRMLSQAALDAIGGREGLSIWARLKIIVQALFSLGLAGRLRRRGIKHIHCHFAHAPTTVGMYTAMQMGIGFSFTGHANDLFQRRILLAQKLRRAELVCCISRWHRQFYQSIVPEIKQKYVLVRCGVDVGQWRFRERLAVFDGQFRVATVCRLVPKKGVDILIRALAQLGRRHGQLWRLTVVGDGPERQRLHSLTQQLGCSGQIDWRGWVENGQITDVLAQADVFALPCRVDQNQDRDGVPVVLMEAMASGVPVVSGDLPSIAELVENGKTGFVVPGDDLDGLVNRLHYLARRPAELAAILAAARNRVEEEFSLEVNLDRLEDVMIARQRGLDV